MKLELITPLEERKAVNGGIVTGGAVFAAGLAGGGLPNIVPITVLALIGFCVGALLTLLFRVFLAPIKRAVKRDVIKTKLLERKLQHLHK